MFVLSPQVSTNLQTCFYVKFMPQRLQCLFWRAQFMWYFIIQGWNNGFNVADGKQFTIFFVEIFLHFCSLSGCYNKHIANIFEIFSHFSTSLLFRAGTTGSMLLMHLQGRDSGSAVQEARYVVAVFMITQAMWEVGLYPFAFFLLHSCSVNPFSYMFLVFVVISNTLFWPAPHFILPQSPG